MAPAGFTALHEAIMRRDARTVATLLAHGADPNAPLRTWTPTRRSSKDFHFPPALVGATPFWLAARFNQPVVMRGLVKHGADPLFVLRAEYAVDKSSQRKREVTTALMAAIGMGGGTGWIELPASERERLTLESVKLAAELGVDINTANTDGRTALDAARAFKYETVIKFLIAQGARSGTNQK
jgi:ankyrin repeat protein